MKTTINVTAEDIAGGKRSACEKCPIALAMLRITGSVWHVEEDAVINADCEVFKIPYAATDFIMDFDAGYTVQPFSFEVELP